MNKTKLTLLLTALMLSAIPLMAQTKKAASTGGNSPHETTSAVIDGNRVTLTYGRPYSKDPKTGDARKIWGTLVPYGKVWRTGSDEATLLITQKAITLGETTIPAGAYTLWTLVNEDGSAKLIVNKQIGQWGVGRGAYDEKDDVTRVELKKEVTETPIEQFTMAVAKNPSGTGGVIKLSWENTQYSAPFTIAK